jgi:hypothetical protein
LIGVERRSRAAGDDPVACANEVPVYRRTARSTIRASAPHLAESIVFCTGAAFTARAQAFLAETDDVVLDKPVDREALFTLLEEDA